MIAEGQKKEPNKLATNQSQKIHKSDSKKGK
jgi:hypothetical protein